VIYTMKKLLIQTWHKFTLLKMGCNFLKLVQKTMNQLLKYLYNCLDYWQPKKMK